MMYLQTYSQSAYRERREFLAINSFVFFFFAKKKKENATKDETHRFKGGWRHSRDGVSGLIDSGGEKAAFSDESTVKVKQQRCANASQSFYAKTKKKK